MAEKFRRTPSGMIITEPKRMKEPKGLLKLQKEKELRKFKGAISEGERQFLKDMLPSMRGANSVQKVRKLMNTINTMGGQPIRGMNSERRKDLLKPSKFRR